MARNNNSKSIQWTKTADPPRRKTESEALQSIDLNNK